MKIKILILLVLVAMASCKKEAVVEPCGQLEKIKAPKFPDVSRPDTNRVIIP